MVDYTKAMKIQYYETNELEIVEIDDSNGKSRIIRNSSPHFILYFRNIQEFIDLLKTSPRLLKELKNILNE